MKKLRAIAAVLMSVFIAVGCSRSEPDNDVSTENDYVFTGNLTEDFVFPEIKIDPNEGLINAFAVTGDDKTALILAAEDGHSYFCVYENGKQISKTEISAFYREMCYNAAENCFYTYNAEKKQFHIMDGDFRFKEVLADNFDVSEIKNMDVIDNKLYLISVKDNPFDHEVVDNALDEETGYYDFGEKVSSIDLSTKEVKDLGVQNVICQSYSNDTLYYYTCRGGHYSLDIYDRKTGKINAVKNMDEIGYIYSFAIIGEEMIYMSYDNLGLAKINLNTGDTLFEPGMVFIMRNSDFEIYKGSLIVLNRDNMSIFRCGGNTGSAANEKLARFKGEKLVIGASSPTYMAINTGALASEGGISATIYEYPMYDEEIKLKLLAGDSDVDIYIFGSGRRTGIDIRRMGCYVPLTDESIINERQKYFDPIADYAVNDNGDIWCMPVSAGADATFYIPENLEKLNIAVEDLTTFDGYFSALEKVKAQNRYLFEGNSVSFADALIDRYKINYSFLNYNNEMFRDLFEYLFSGWVMWSNPAEGKNEHPLFTRVNNAPWEPLKAEDMAFTFEYSSSRRDRLDDLNKWHATALPIISSADEKNPVYVSYAIINPFSEKKEAAEAYLGFIAENDMKFLRNSPFLFKDKALYGDDVDTACFDGLYDIFENGAVYEARIACTPGVHKEEIAYQMGETTLDEYIAELERVAEMSENE